MNSAGCSQGLQRTVLWTIWAFRPGLCRSLPEALFWDVSFHEGFAWKWRPSCHHPAPLLSTHTVLGNSSNHDFQKIIIIASPLYCCLFYKVREVFLLSLMKALYAFFFRLKLWKYCLNAGFLLAKLFLVFNYLSWSQPRKPLSQSHSGYRAAAKPQQSLSKGNSSDCQSDAWTVCCHPWGRSFEFRELLFDSQSPQ